MLVVVNEKFKSRYECTKHRDVKENFKNLEKRQEKPSYSFTKLYHNWYIKETFVHIINTIVWIIFVCLWFFTEVFELFTSVTVEYFDFPLKQQ